MKESNIISKYREKLPGHWTSIENSVSSGVPDYSVSRRNSMCWIEFKRLYDCVIIVRPLQRNWMIRELKHNSDIWVAWWNAGPCAIRADALLGIEPAHKGGKLHYNVIDNAFVIYGWHEIDNYLFGKTNV